MTHNFKMLSKDGFVIWECTRCGKLWTKEPLLLRLIDDMIAKGEL